MIANTPSPAPAAPAPAALALFQQALARHEAGDFKAAIALDLEALAVQPDIPEIHNNLGTALVALGRPEAALPAFGWAVILAPAYARGYYNFASALLTLGHAAAAAQTFRHAARIKPDYAAAHHNHGLALKAIGRFGEALAAYHRAIALGPAAPEAWLNLGNSLVDQGALVEAEAAYRRALILQPDYAPTHDNLGNVLRVQGDNGAAVAAYRRAIVLQPDDPRFPLHLCETLLALEQFRPAAAIGWRAVLLHPGDLRALHTLAFALVEANAGAAALALHRHIVAREPDRPEVYSNLATTLLEYSAFGDAIAAAHRVRILAPGSAEGHFNLGNALSELRQDEAAIALFRQALALNPADERAHNNLGHACTIRNQTDDALTAFSRAIRIVPGDPGFHVNRAMILLQRGAFREGWAEYEWRWKFRHFSREIAQFKQPIWRGEPLVGRSILLIGEQGFGDIIQFARYAPLLAAQGAQVMISAFRPLARLLRSVAGVAAVAPFGTASLVCDFQLPMLSAPHALGTDLDTIPATVPYVKADPTFVGFWQRRLAKLPGLKVGLVWAGDSHAAHRRAFLTDRRRSLRLEQFDALSRIPGVTLVSLQKGNPALQRRTAALGGEIIDWMDEVMDFADTAALIEALDLVIAVDTAVAHLAGALGKPVWILSRFDACWRWLLDREDTPWYPTARLFRQRQPGDWDEVLARVTAALEQAVAATEAR
ncbi:MAG: tetratricopeptide repeat protein [Azospirillaceae bacterium]|nr:tetratricopeptide repeat protein [Azospirillaceae bacterium]